MYMDISNFVKSEFKKYSEPEYKKFSSSLIPNIDNILGIRLPNLRKIAKIIAKNDWQTFLNNYEENFMEDTMLKGMVIAHLKEDYDSMVSLVEKFVPKINNWAVCDIFCGGLKFFKKDKIAALKFLYPYLKSQDEYELRFGVVSLLSHFICDDCIDEVLRILFNLKTERYYAQMGIAWAVSICYIKYPDLTLNYLKDSTLDDFCHSKSISKIIESYRVSKEDKEKLKLLKRPRHTKRT